MPWNVDSHSLGDNLTCSALVICNHGPSPGGGCGKAMEMSSVLLLHCPHSEVGWGYQGCVLGKKGSVMKT